MEDQVDRRGGEGVKEGRRAHGGGLVWGEEEEEEEECP